MREIDLIYRKEFKDLWVKRSLVVRFILLLFLSIIFASMPQGQLPIGNSYAQLAFWYMLFCLFAVMGFLSNNSIGKEKTHRTLETLLSVPLKLSNVFWGMAAFMFTVGFVFLCLVTVYDNIWLHFVANQSFMMLADGWPQLIVFYVLGVLAILLMIMLGLVLSLFSNNFRVNQFAVLAIGLALIYGFNVFMQHYTAQLCSVVLVVFVALLGLIFMSIQKHMNKQYALKFAK